MYTTTPSNWPKAAASRLREQHSPQRPPSVYCNDSPREGGVSSAPGEGDSKFDFICLACDDGAAARASARRIIAQRGSLNEGQNQKRAAAILAAIDSAQRPMTSGEIISATGRSGINRDAMYDALAKLVKVGRIVAARHGLAGHNWHSLPEWGPDRRLPDPGTKGLIQDSEIASDSTRMLRAIQEAGHPMTNAAIAMAALVPSKRVGAYLQPMLRSGTVLRSGERGRYLYSLAPTKPD